MFKEEQISPWSIYDDNANKMKKNMANIYNP